MSLRNEVLSNTGRYDTCDAPGRLVSTNHRHILIRVTPVDITLSAGNVHLNSPLIPDFDDCCETSDYSDSAVIKYSTRSSGHFQMKPGDPFNPTSSTAATLPVRT